MLRSFCKLKQLLKRMNISLRYTTDQAAEVGDGEDEEERAVKALMIRWCSNSHVYITIIFFLEKYLF
ncbi:hypothetical protein N665_0645s0006 [Sinapis alba]|nr:hypothetical protein N665_0645s0006 [Sinapis alba]